MINRILLLLLIGTMVIGCMPPSPVKSLVQEYPRSFAKDGYIVSKAVAFSGPVVMLSRKTESGKLRERLRIYFPEHPMTGEITGFRGYAPTDVNADLPPCDIKPLILEILRSRTDLPVVGIPKHGSSWGLPCGPSSPTCSTLYACPKPLGSEESKRLRWSDVIIHQRGYAPGTPPTPTIFWAAISGYRGRMVVFLDENMDGDPEVVQYMSAGRRDVTLDKERVTGWPR